MRRINAVITALIMVLFVFHGVAGSFRIMGISSAIFKTLAWIMTGLIAVHAVLSTIMTVDTLKAMKSSGAAYWKGNELFWARRISGYALFVLIFFHIWAFGHTVDGVYRLAWFTKFKLVTQLLMVSSLAVHVMTNIRPLLMGFGVRSIRDRLPGLLLALSILIAFMILAFVIYYIRWNLV